MERLQVVIAPKQTHTDLLAMAGPTEVLRARLGSPALVHRMVAPLLLEGLSLWHQCPISVVVELLGPGRHRAQRLGGPGDFRSLRRLCQGATP